MAKYKKKPVVIEAIEWNGHNLREIIAFTGLHKSIADLKISDERRWDDYTDLVEKEGLKIFTIEGPLMASIGDFIIKGVQGEFYPCKPDIFKQTYDPITPPTEQTDCTDCPEMAVRGCGDCEQTEADIEAMRGLLKDAKRCLSIHCDFTEDAGEKHILTDWLSRYDSLIGDAHPIDKDRI